MEERAKNGARTKKARGGMGEGENEGKEETADNRCQKIFAAVGGLSFLIGQFWLFRQQVSRHDGISSFSIVMTACSFENVLKFR